MIYVCFSAQAQGLLCEEAGNYGDNVKYCGYCSYHFKKLVSVCYKHFALFYHLSEWLSGNGEGTVTLYSGDTHFDASTTDSF